MKKISKGKVSNQHDMVYTFIRGSVEREVDEMQMQKVN